MMTREPVKATVIDIETVQNYNHTGRRVHLHILLEDTARGVTYRYRAKNGKVTHRATQNLHVRVFDVVGYSSEMAVFAENNEGKLLSATPIISVTGTRDVAKVLKENFNVLLSWAPDLGEPIAEHARETKATSKIK